MQGRAERCPGSARAGFARTTKTSVGAQEDPVPRFLATGRSQRPGAVRSLRLGNGVQCKGADGVALFRLFRLYVNQENERIDYLPDG
jgi:hypothetical protein